MKTSKTRKIISLIFSVIFVWVYIPHLIAYLLCNQKNDIKKDIIQAYKIDHIARETIGPGDLVFLLHTNAYFRTLFYHRIGIVGKTLIGWYRPGDKYFQIPHTTRLGGGVGCYHPFATILNASEIGENFVCRNNTTIGYRDDTGVRPKIGDNVNLGVGVVIIGPIRIGNNVTVGAGAVVVKDIPDNVVIAGNPAHIVSYKK